MCLCPTNNKRVFGIGKGKWRMLEGGIFQVWIQNLLIYNPLNISLPINLQTAQTSRTPSNSSHIFSEETKKKHGMCLCPTINKHVFGVGKV
jgi:hypothetical protein